MINLSRSVIVGSNIVSVYIELSTIVKWRPLQIDAWRNVTIYYFSKRFSRPPYGQDHVVFHVDGLPRPKHVHSELRAGQSRTSVVS